MIRAIERSDVLTPDSPAVLFSFDRERLIREAVAIHELTGAGIVPLKGKVAALKDWREKAKRSPQAIRDSLGNQWVTGAGVLLEATHCVVDTDTPEAEQWARENLPATLTVKTLKGYHRYYTVPNPVRQDRSKLHPGVDVISQRNYTLYVGSVHPDTGQVEYAYINESRAISALPDDMVQTLSAPRAKRPKGASIPKQRVGVEPSPLPMLESGEDVSAILERVRKKPSLIAMMNDTSDGRDNRIYRATCSLVQSGCTTTSHVMAVLSLYPLWQKVTEAEDPHAYITHKVESAHRFIAENPAKRMTVAYWQGMVAGAKLSSGMLKVLCGIGMEAARQTQLTGNEATRITIGKRSLGLWSAMGPTPALRWLKKAEEEHWLKRVSDPGRVTGYAPVFLLTVPYGQKEEAEVVVVDFGHDAFRHGALKAALPVYMELHRGSGKADELAERIGSNVVTTRKNLNKLKDAEVADKAKMVWSLNEDHDLKLDAYAEKVGTLGRRDADKTAYAEQSKAWNEYRAMRSARQ